MPDPHTYGRIPFFFALQGEVLAPPRGVENAAPPTNNRLHLYQQRNHPCHHVKNFLPSPW